MVGNLPYKNPSTPINFEEDLLRFSPDFARCPLPSRRLHHRLFDSLFGLRLLGGSFGHRMIGGSFGRRLLGIVSIAHSDPSPSLAGTAALRLLDNHPLRSLRRPTIVARFATSISRSLGSFRRTE
ncbi:hypothetical protein Dimus_001279, partial [Dionaea muscipula]